MLSQSLDRQGIFSFEIKDIVKINLDLMIKLVQLLNYKNKN